MDDRPIFIVITPHTIDAALWLGVGWIAGALLYHFALKPLARFMLPIGKQSQTPKGWRAE